MLPVCVMDMGHSGMPCFLRLLFEGELLLPGRHSRVCKQWQLGGARGGGHQCGSLHL